MIKHSSAEGAVTEIVCFDVWPFFHVILFVCCVKVSVYFLTDIATFPSPSSSAGQMQYRAGSPLAKRRCLIEFIIYPYRGVQC